MATTLIECITDQINCIKNDSSSLTITYAQENITDTIYWDNDKLFYESGNNKVQQIYHEINSFLDIFVYKLVTGMYDLATLTKQKNGILLMTLELVLGEIYNDIVEFYRTINPATPKITKHLFYSPGDDCSICLEQLKGTRQICALNCNHVFHRGCVVYLKKCPLCVQQIKTLKIILI
jgi:hypothetical protein